MPFRYSLQRVLDLVDRKEREVDAKVMAAASARDQELARLADLEFRRTAAQKGLNGQLQAGPAADVAAANDYIQFLGQRLGQQQRALAAAEDSLKQIQELQQAVRRERRKLEKHREMKRDEWSAEERRREARRIDEMAGGIFMKRRFAAEEEQAEVLERLEKLEKLRQLRELRERRDKESRW
ncbi:MAG: flagellar export protein FliJ [Candidatus Sericytochromatia bacterium]|nr:flagellar export protein FliJ [Candidatus Sericytochromatia bacterium]